MTTNYDVDDDTAATDPWIGILGVAVASFVWGSCFIVCKGYDMPKDGVHFAFLMSIGILLVGFATVVGSSAVEDGDFEVVLAPQGLLGGGLWACGNFLTVPIIERVGLGIGLALWAGTNMIVAFLIGAIGLESMGLNLPKEPLKNPVFGFLGVVLAVAALVLFALVKPKADSNNGNNNSRIRAVNLSDIVRQAEAEDDDGDEYEQQNQRAQVMAQPSASQPLLRHYEVSSSSSPTPSYHSCNSDEEEARQRHHIIHFSIDDDGSDIMDDSSHKNIPMGIFMAIIAGTLYGFQFVPLSMWNAKTIHNGHIFDQSLPTDMIRSLRFFFSQFAGIFLTALMGFSLYCLCTRNRPQLVPPEATLPSILCGAVWAIGCAGAMLATSGLGNAVGFPLLLNCAFLVNSAWSILVFKEIQGKRNLRLFGAAFLLNVMSSIFISLAKG